MMRASWACRRQVKREYLFLCVSPDNVATRCKKCAKAAEFACWQYKGSFKTPVAKSLQNGVYHSAAYLDTGMAGESGVRSDWALPTRLHESRLHRAGDEQYRPERGRSLPLKC